MFSLEELFYRVDDFCQAFEPRWQQQLLTHQLQTRQRSRQLCLSEIMTILTAFHASGLPHVQRLLPYTNSQFAHDRNSQFSCTRAA